MNYPSPDENPLCQCKGNPLAAFWCGHGHMTECHFPFSCQEAACSHLRRYDFSEEEIEELEADVRVSQTLYEFDEHGNATVNIRPPSSTPPPAPPKVKE